MKRSEINFEWFCLSVALPEYVRLRPPPDSVRAGDAAGAALAHAAP